MKMRLLLFLVVLYAAHSSCNNKNFVRIAFYNLENLFDTLDDPKIADEEFTPEGKNAWTSDKYWSKINNMAKVIDALEPDILGVCEVENKRVLRDLTLKTSNKAYKIAHHESPDIRGIDVALLYDKKMFKFLSQEAIQVDLSAFSERTRDILLVSGILYGKDTAGIYVCHWPSRRGGRDETEPKRLLAAKALKTHMLKTRAAHPEWRILIMGDFNDGPKDISISDVLEASGMMRTGSIYNPFVQAEQEGKGTLKYRGSWDMFDQIMYVPSAINEPWLLDFGIFNREWLLQQEGDYKGYPHRTFGGTTWLNGYSDHLPVYVDFKVLK